MARKAAVYLSNEIEMAIEAMYKDKPKTSEAIRVFAERYLAMVANHTPELATREWCLIFDAYNGCMTSGDPNALAAMLPISIQDSLPDGLSEKWDADGQALVAKLAALNFAERIAVIDMADRFWAGSWDGFSDYDEIVSRLLLRAPATRKQNDQGGLPVTR